MPRIKMKCFEKADFLSFLDFFFLVFKKGSISGGGGKARGEEMAQRRDFGSVAFTKGVAEP
jgi:hypothetical protein